MANILLQLLFKHKTLIIVLFITIAIFGYRAYRDIPIDAFPDITPKQVLIYTESNGNSAEDIEKLITYPIESALSGMAGVKSIMSNSIFGLSYISIFFEDDMDIHLLRQLVTERIGSVDIPKGWGKPTLGPNTTGLGQVFWYQLKDNTAKYSLSELREIHDYIVTPLLKSVKGVEDAIGWGGHKKQYEVIIDTKKLQNFDITYDDIVNAIEKNNQAAGGQYLEFNQELYLIRGIGFYKSIEDIKNSVVKAGFQDTITIRDIAEVKEGVAPRFGAVSIDGDEAVMGMVLQRSGTNAANLVKLIQEKIQTINDALPQGVEIKTIYDRSDITHKAIDTMTSALYSGIILVSIILFIFLFEIRSAFIVILSIPVSLLIAFLLMRYFGISANLMSLSGLAIAVGMIVDGTIVIVENSFRKLQLETNKDKLTIIIESLREVSKSIIFAILIIAVVFIPLLSLDGLSGKLYSPMALNIVFVMLASLFVALTLVPVLTLLLLKRTNSNDFIMQKIKAFYTPLLSFALLHSKALLFGVSILFVALAFILSKQGREFMPKLNEESIMYRVISIPSTALSQSVINAKDIEKHILKNYPNEVESVLSMIGRSEKGETSQANYMEVLLTLKPNIKNLQKLSDTINDDLEESFTHLQFVPTQPIAMRIEELLEGVRAELAVKIYGEDQKHLQELAKEIQYLIKGIEGVEHIEAEEQLGQMQLSITPNYMAMARYGINADEVMQIIKNGIGEEAISQKIEGVRRFDIVAKIKDAKKDIDAIKNITLRSHSGEVVLLHQICDISVNEGASFIKRENLSRYIVLSIDIKDRDIASFVQEANSLIKQKIKFPTGYYSTWTGEFKNMQEASNKLMIIIPATLFLISFLLFIAFDSVSKAMLILMNIPLGLIGGIIALIISGIYLSVSSVIGFLAIFAIAALNGIVLVSFIDELRLKYPHKVLIDIIKEATMLRLRPVLMTALTTLFGILPLLYATGVGSEIQYPLAVVVVGGIISSTLLTLLILPSAYLLFYRREKSE